MTQLTRKMSLRAMIALLAVTFIAVTGMAEETPAANLLKNSGFEDGTDNWSGINQTVKVTEFKKDFNASFSPQSRSGTIALQISNRGVSAGVAQSVTVKPGATYTVTAFVRFLSQPGESYARILARGAEYSDLGNTEHCNGTDWQQVQHTFMTAPDDTQIQIICNVRGTGEALFDDITLVEGRPQEQRGQNLVYNSSFEFATTPDVPDGWNCYLGSALSHEFYSRWRLVTDEAFDGEKSMYLDNPFQRHTHNFKLSVAMAGGMHLQPGEDCVISFYAKGSQPGATIKLTGDFALTTELVTLTTEWQRHETRATPKPTTENTRAFGHSFSFLPGAGGCWIDAVMLERGTEVSPYSRRLGETPLVTPSLDTGQKGEEGLPLEALETAPQPHKGGKPSTVRVNPIDGNAPVIDGELTDACWKDATTIRLDHEVNGKPITQITEVSLLRNERNLYVGFRCFDNDIKNIKAAIKEHDDAVWTDDCVEIFVDSAHNHKDFYQFIANATGVSFDTYNTQRIYNPAYQVKSHQGEDSWTVEFALPYAIFDPVPLKELIWGLSFCRENHKANEYTYWGGAFRDMENAGHLLGLEAEALARYMLSEENVVLTLDKMDPRIATLQMTINNQGEEFPSRATIFLRDDKGNDLGSRQISAVMTAKGETALLFPEISIPLASSLLFTTACIETPDGSELIKNFARRQLAIPARPRLYPYLSYFSREEHLRMVFDCGGSCFPAGTVLSANLETINLANGERVVLQTLTEQLQTGVGQYELVFASTQLPAGVYPVVATVSFADGKQLKFESETVKKPFMEGETKICNRLRSLWVDGKPFFPVGLTYHFDRDPDREQWRHFLTAAKERGFNTLETTFKIDPEGLSRLEEYLILAESLGFKVFLHIQNVPTENHNKSNDPRWHKKAETVLAGIKEFIPRFRNHKIIIGWHVTDEVAMEVLSKGESAAWFEACRELAPNQINYANLLGSPQRLNEMSQFLNGSFPGDLLSTTGSYAVPNLPLTRLSDCCDILMRTATPKPLYPWIQSWSGTGRCPNPAEARGLVYLAVIHGATGYKFWPGPTNSRLTWDYCKVLNEEMLSLAPVVFSETIPFSGNDRFIHCLAKRYEGKTYLLTVNSLNAAYTAQLDLSPLGVVESASRVFEETPATLDGSTLAEKYEPYGRRVFIINEKHATDE
jgi:hypothetical protein